MKTPAVYMYLSSNMYALFAAAATSVLGPRSWPGSRFTIWKEWSELYGIISRSPCVGKMPKCRASPGSKVEQTLLPPYPFRVIIRTYAEEVARRVNIISI